MYDEDLFPVFKPYRVTFIGHRYIDEFNKVEEHLTTILDELANQHPYIDFYIGNNGEFDTIATSVVRRLIEKGGKENFSLTLVLPYAKADMEFLEEQFDDVIIPPSLYGVHPKAAITERNRWMVENSDALVAYVTHGKGGAATCLRMAEKLERVIIRV